MDTNFETWVTRINHTLEYSILPEVQSHHQRVQILAVAELLTQIAPRLEYRHDLALEDIQHLQKVRQIIVSALENSNIKIPEALACEPEDRSADTPETSPKDRIHQLENAVRSAIDFMYECHEQIENFKQVEKDLLQQINNGVLRDLMLYKPSEFAEKQKKYQERPT